MDQTEKYIYFIRHGQSIDNVSDVFQGPHSELTELGQRQARFVAERAKTLPLQVILASPFKRAYDTAMRIHEATDVPLEVHDVLREYVAPSSLWGTPRTTPAGVAYIEELKERYGDPTWHYEDGDNEYELHQRALELIALLIARPEQHIAAVTHAGFMRVVISAMMTEGEFDPISIRRLARFLAPVNTGITVCRYRSAAVRRNKWRMISWNDHAHLAETDKEEPVEASM